MHLPRTLTVTKSTLTRNLRNPAIPLFLPHPSSRSM
jgi:hypothetical protein